MSSNLAFIQGHKLQQQLLTFLAFFQFVCYYESSTGTTLTHYTTTILFDVCVCVCVCVCVFSNFESNLAVLPKTVLLRAFPLRIISIKCHQNSV